MIKKDFDACIKGLNWLHSVGATLSSVSTNMCPDAALAIFSVVVSHFPNLKTVEINILDEDTVVPDAIVLLIALGCPNLTTFDCGGRYGDTVLSTLTEHCHRLQKVFLAENLVTDAGINSLCTNCFHLRHIGLFRCDDLTDTSLVAIANAFPKLQSISISGCYFTDDGIAALANKCHALQTVTMSYPYNISAAGLSCLWAANPLITDIFILDFCMTDADVLHLAQCCSLLKSLVLLNCGVSDNDMLAARRLCPNIRHAAAMEIDLDAADNDTDDDEDNLA